MKKLLKEIFNTFFNTFTSLNAFVVVTVVVVVVTKQIMIMRGSRDNFLVMTVENQAQFISNCDDDDMPKRYHSFNVPQDRKGEKVTIDKYYLRDYIFLSIVASFVSEYVRYVEFRIHVFF